MTTNQEWDNKAIAEIEAKQEAYLREHGPADFQSAIVSQHPNLPGVAIWWDAESLTDERDDIQMTFDMARQLATELWRVAGKE